MTDDPMELRFEIQKCADRLRHLIKPEIEGTPNAIVVRSMMLVSAMGAWLAAGGDREIAAKYFDDVANGMRSGAISFGRGENIMN